MATDHFATNGVVPPNTAQTSDTPVEAPPSIEAQTLRQRLDAFEMWEEAEPFDRLQIILTHFTDPEAWLDPEPLAALAHFRHTPAGLWGKIRLRYGKIGGNPFDLLAAVDQLLQEQGHAATEAPTEETPPLSAALISYAEFLDLHLPPRETYMAWLKAQSLNMLYGPRGVGKTMALLGVAMSLTTGRPFLKWPVTRTVGVLYVDGEMPLDDLRSRARTLAGRDTPSCLTFLPSELVYSRTGRDLTLTGVQNRQAIEAMLEARPALKVLVLDNVSCLFPGICEDKKQDWEPVNAWLIQLRHRGVTVIFGHHAGKGGQQRGTSGREDALDTVIALTRPPGHQAKDGCHFHWQFEKSRGVKGSVVEGLDVRLDETPGGLDWTSAPLETRRAERIRLMLADGMPPKTIADELGISASYVYRCKKDPSL
jgi:hypothetical protein